MYTPHTHRGAGAYARLGVETQAMSASPHQLICMLFDGAAAAIGMARHHMGAGNIAAKGQAISKAVSIVDNGLKAGLDAKAAGDTGTELVANLSALYDYVIRRLLQANLHDDARALDEAEALLDNVASAWREIGAADR
ncbi:flagellar export chaperone FliS [Variovorax sp. JS1663]|uniref:flagellar export chaperone FliS n=1 Tax=Variovorax sp. JS1663 TaxID=1851577 RepID=UPI000B348D81|nr:flagellar export chaperone FliS [Variovorax sp. JS1663]OUL99232.1 flagellar export chaperone FliS [Variovorax sp. JS1663]